MVTEVAFLTFYVVPNVDFSKEIAQLHLILSFEVTDFNFCMKAGWLNCFCRIFKRVGFKDLMEGFSSSIKM